MNTRNIIYGIICCAGLGACSNGAVFYDIGQKRSIYFDQEERQDTVEFSFSFYAVDIKEYVYQIPVKVTGVPVTGEQTFAVEVLTGATAQVSTHYEWEEMKIPKGEVKGYLKVKLKRTADMMESPFYLHFRLMENENFRPLSDEETYCLSIADGILPEPHWWTVGKSFLGEYKNDNYKLYQKILENFRALEEINPIFYTETVESYGLYLENAPDGFFQKYNTVIWVKYVLKPPYDFFMLPENSYEGFAMVNPDRFIR